MRGFVASGLLERHAVGARLVAGGLHELPRLGLPKLLGQRASVSDSAIISPPLRSRFARIRCGIDLKPHQRRRASARIAPAA